MLAAAGRPAGAGPAGRVDAPGGAGQHRLDDDPAAVLGRGRRRSRGPARTGTSRAARSSGTTCRRPWPGRTRRCRPGGAGPAASRRPGRSGSSILDQRQRARPGAQRRALSEPATLAAAKRGRDRANWMRLHWSLTGPPWRGASGSRPRAARRLGPVLDVPAPLAGDGGQLGLGVHRHRVADRLQHRQVAGRVGVGHGVRQRQALGLGVGGHEQGPGLARRRHVDQLAGERPSCSSSRAHTTSSNSGRSGSTTKSSDPVMQHRAVAQAAVLPHPAEARRGTTC